MAKNIVICSDGTGNTGIKGRGTNVFKLFESVDLNGHRWDPALVPQVAFYDDGVGSENFKPLRVLGGIAGAGLGENVRQLYKELARIYDPGDRIYMFGFSRGAFTVRTLVGLIATCGLIDPHSIGTAKAFDQRVKDAYRAYRRCYRTELSRRVWGEATRDAGRAFREKAARKEDVRIRFVGVWDTVDAVGLPFHISDVINSTLVRFKFPDPYLSDCVDQACHALSIDDARHSFHPLVWNHQQKGDRLEQVWFAGVHSNVGGGYEKHGLSLIALDWMMAKSEAAGLRYNERDRQFVREHASVDDKLYDPRAGLGTFYRWKPRSIADICEANGAPALVHLSVLERIAHGVDHYAPANLPPAFRVVTTPPAGGQNPSLGHQRAANVEGVCRELQNDSQSLIESLRGAVFVGRLSYYLFLVACIATLLGVAVFSMSHRSSMALPQSVAGLVVAVLTDPFDIAQVAVRAVRANPIWFSASALLLVVSSILSRMSDSRISDSATRFWYKNQRKLREALKDARRSLAI